MNKSNEKDLQKIRVEAEDAMYRDNPLLKQIHDIEKKLKEETDQTAYWRAAYQKLGEQFAEERKVLKTKHQNFSRAMSKLMLWIVFIPTWFAVGLACLGFPFWAYFSRRVPVDIFWFVPLGLILLGVLFYVLSSEEEKLG